MPSRRFKSLGQIRWLIGRQRLLNFSSVFLLQPMMSVASHMKFQARVANLQKLPKSGLPTIQIVWTLGLGL